MHTCKRSRILLYTRLDQVKGSIAPVSWIFNSSLYIHARTDRQAWGLGCSSFSCAWNHSEPLKALQSPGSFRVASLVHQGLSKKSSSTHPKLRASGSQMVLLEMAADQPSRVRIELDLR